MRKWQPAILLATLLLITLAVLSFGVERDPQSSGARAPLLPASSSGPRASFSQSEQPADPPDPVEPSSIDLADLPADSRRAENKYDLWLRGELGEGTEGFGNEEELASLKEAALLLEPSHFLSVVCLFATSNRSPRASTLCYNPPLEVRIRPSRMR